MILAQEDAVALVVFGLHNNHETPPIWDALRAVRVLAFIGKTHYNSQWHYQLWQLQICETTLCVCA